MEILTSILRHSSLLKVLRLVVVRDTDQKTPLNLHLVSSLIDGRLGTSKLDLKNITGVCG